MTSFRQICAYQRARPKTPTVAQRLPVLFQLLLQEKIFCQTKPFDPRCQAGVAASCRRRGDSPQKPGPRPRNSGRRIDAVARRNITGKLLPPLAQPIRQQYPRQSRPFRQSCLRRVIPRLASKLCLKTV
jgi:hypothetical protein